MKNFYRAFIATLAIILLTACQGQDPSKDFAQKLARDFIDSVNSGNYDQAFQSTEDQFFAIRPRDRWIAYYKAIKNELGPVISIKLSQSLTDDRFSGRFYMYQFSIKHEKGFTKEMVTMIKKINSNDPLKISGHKIDSSKLRKINEMY